jgi:hypothetical protein
VIQKPTCKVLSRISDHPVNRISELLPGSLNRSNGGLLVVESQPSTTLIASTLEGSHMMSRLQKKEEPRDLAVRHLEEHLETEVRAQKAKAGADQS